MILDLFALLVQWHRSTVACKTEETENGYTTTVVCVWCACTRVRGQWTCRHSQVKSVAAAEDVQCIRRSFRWCVKGCREVGGGNLWIKHSKKMPFSRTRIMLPIYYSWQYRVLWVIYETRAIMWSQSSCISALFNILSPETKNILLPLSGVSMLQNWLQPPPKISRNLKSNILIINSKAYILTIRRFHNQT